MSINLGLSELMHTPPSIPPDSTEILVLMLIQNTLHLNFYTLSKSP